MKQEPYKKETQDIVVLKPQNLTKTSETVKDEIYKYWEKDYIKQQISRIKNSGHKMLMTFLWMTGVRITEAITLRKQDIAFSNYLMTVRWLKNRKYNRRKVPLHPHLKDILEVYTAAMKAEDRIFPISRQRAWQLVQKYFNGHPHQFRHSFAVNWLRCDGKIEVLSQVMGHSDIKTTMQYLQLVPRDQGKELMQIDF